MTTKYNAQALMGEVQKEHPSLSGYTLAVFAVQRAIEQKEATKQEFDDFRQEVSDAVMQAFPNTGLMPDCLGKFVVPAPKPDPLEEVLTEISGEGGFDNFDHYAHRLRTELDALGFEIREKNDD